MVSGQARPKGLPTDLWTLEHGISRLREIRRDLRAFIRMHAGQYGDLQRSPSLPIRTVVVRHIETSR